LIATIGLHGSASTWVFNIVRELVAATVGEERMLTFYADELAQFPEEASRAGKHLVLKSHHGSHDLDAWLQGRAAPVILSLRDPRDACLSMSQRFAAPLQHSVQWIAQDCRRLLRLAERGYPQLHFEDRFFEERASVDRLCGWLGLSCAPSVKDDIFGRYRTDAVRSFARRLEELPPERLTMVAGHRMDRVTQVLAPHIGDARSGKWRDLPAQVQAELTRFFRPFLDRFGYEAEGPRPVSQLPVAKAES
jgi:hypothetical protein